MAVTRQRGRRAIRWSRVKFDDKSNPEVARVVGCSRQRVAVMREHYGENNPLVRRRKRLRIWFRRHKKKIKSLPLSEIQGLLTAETGYTLSKPSVCVWRKNGGWQK